MKCATLASFVFLTWTPFALADDVNRTGQSQTNDAGKADSAAQGGDANTMGAGNATATSQSEDPPKGPVRGESPGEAKMNAETNAPLAKH